MKIFYHIRDIKETLSFLKHNNKSVGFVPTMGALHQGHISLIEASRKENDITVCSIYVNPAQFNNKNDLKNYPKTVAKDLEMLAAATCDLVFVPSDNEMYPQPPRMDINFGSLGEVMEGKFRKGHFAGVAIVVSKLLHIVEPDIAYFGQKDLQQLKIIKQMAFDLSFNTEIKCVATLREKDGLAMSSRNMRLNDDQRKIAPKIYQGLRLSEELLKENSVAEVKNEVTAFFEVEPSFRLEYFEIVDSETLEPVSTVKDHHQIACCVAVNLGDVRLIDNLLLFS